MEYATYYCNHVDVSTTSLISILFTGVGWAMVLISAMVSAYYNVIIMYSIYYMMVSFVSLDTKLPWQSCDPEWATELCRQEAYPDFHSMTNLTEMHYEAMSELIGF
jgi:solute carrier family 6 amino acid transporter-like protein 5/7/9/14